MADSDGSEGSEPPGSGIPLGGIIGIAVASIALITVLIIILYLLCKRHHDKASHVTKRNHEYAEVGDDIGRADDPASQYATVQFNKSENYKQEKKKVKDTKNERKVEAASPIYAQVRGGVAKPPSPDSPEPRYANLNIQSSVWPQKEWSVLERTVYINIYIQCDRRIKVAQLRFFKGYWFLFCGKRPGNSLKTSKLN